MNEKKPYQPTEEEVQNAEALMTAEQVKGSNNRVGELRWHFQDPEDRFGREAVIKAVSRGGGTALEHAAPEFQGDREIVLIAVKQDGSNLKFAAPALKADREIVLEANEQPRSKLRGIEHPSLNSFRGKPRGIEPGGI